MMRCKIVDFLRLEICHELLNGCVRGDVEDPLLNCFEWAGPPRHRGDMVPLGKQLSRDDYAILARPPDDEAPHQYPTISISGRGKISLPPRSRNARSR